MTKAISVAYEDNHLIAVHKPAGLLSQAARAGDDNVVDRVKGYLKRTYDKPGNVYVGLVHRLDRNVSGVMLVARTSKAAARLTRAFAERRVEKGYLAVVDHPMPARHGRLEHRIAARMNGRGVVEDSAGKPAALMYRAMTPGGPRQVVAVALETGRKHQIRAQLAWTGCAIVGDPLYGRRDPIAGRPMLHAWRLAIEHPVRREPLELWSPLSGPMKRLVSSLGFDTAQGWPFP